MMTGTYYRNLLTVMSVAIFYTNVPIYTNMIATNAKESAPILWVIGLCALSLPLLIGQMLRSNIWKSPLVLWCFGYAWITVMWFFLSSQSDMPWQEVRWRFLTIIELFVFLALFANPDAIGLVRQTLAAAVLFGVALNVYELFVPLSFSSLPGRSTGLYLNPNQSGEALVMGMLFAVTILPSWVRGPFILITGIGVFTTFSRGAILQWVIVVVGFMLMGRVGLKNVLLSISMSLLLVALVLLPRWDELLTTLGNSGVINKNVEERLDWFTDPSGVSDYSSWERKYLAKQAWDKTADHPFLGNGTGSSREMAAGAHNQYLMFMQDHGLLGAAILPLLVLAVTWRARGEARGVAIVFGCIIIVRGFFSHDILNQAESLMLFALMAIMSSSRETEMEQTLSIATAEVTAPRVLART